MSNVFNVDPAGEAPPYPVLLAETRRDVMSHVEEVWKPSWKRAVLIADDTTRELFAEPLENALSDRGLSPLVCSFAPGEESKMRATKAAIEDRMLEAGVDRSACVVAIGGGIVLDVAGFVAATFMRGLPHINVATTLLAQVDAAIGGKTAVNTPRGKNLIGAIHHPRAVIIDTAALASLDDVDLRCGLAEAVKHAVLSDAALFDRLEAWARDADDLRPPRDVLTRCIAIKADVVADDDRDRGKRNILNYGHTVAHAIEHATGHATPHGYAVAMGMVVESRLAARAGRFPADDLERLVALLEALGLPAAPGCAFEAASPYLSRDKKSRGGDIRCAIPERIGTTVAEDDGTWTRVVSAEAIREAWT
jgi:3-dehydroquinate synthase